MAAARRVIGRALAFAASLWAASVAAQPLSIADALQPPTITSMRLSPDGKRLLVVGRSKEAAGAYVLDVETLTPTLVAVYRSSWSPEFSTIVARWVDDQRLMIDAPDVRIVDLTGKTLRQIGGDFFGWTTNAANGHRRMLVRGRRNASYVERIDVDTGDGDVMNFPYPGAPFWWLFDKDGAARAATTTSTAFWSDDTTTTQWYRKSLDDPWIALETAPFLEETWRPWQFTADGGSLVVFSSAGRDTTAVFRYSLEERKLKEMMAGHPTEDVAMIESDAGGAGQTVEEANDNAFLRVVTTGMRPRVHWFEPRWAALQRAVDAALPDRHNWLTGSLSKRVLIASSSDTDPGTWFLLDPGTMTMKEIGRALPHIDPARMAPQRIVSYRSADGLAIPAYLSVPRGSTGKLPAVVLVHGGPIKRDEWGWDPEVQMLVSRGFAVLQPQFRGSSGFGNAYRTAGYGQWGLAMQDDVTAGAEWLVSEGIADPARMCIYGASYGGYAAMWALAKTPDLFRCGASFAGVSDLNYMFRDDSDSNDSPKARLALRLIAGDPKKEMKRFEAVSPLRHAADIRAPLLLAHGEQDQRVPIAHSEKMLSAMKEQGKTVEWIKLAREGHGIYYPEHQQRFYTALFAFLSRHTHTPMAPESVASSP